MQCVCVHGPACSVRCVACARVSDRAAVLRCLCAAVPSAALLLCTSLHQHLSTGVLARHACACIAAMQMHGARFLSTYVSASSAGVGMQCAQQMLSRRAAENFTLPTHPTRRVSDAAAARPRRRASMAAAEEGARDPVAALPPALALRVFALLPLDTRMRCAEVCPGWSKALGDPSLWSELDLTQLSSGVACTDAAAKRAAGGLQTLRLPAFQLSDATLCSIAAANAATLRELRLDQGAEAHVLAVFEKVLRAAPQLWLLEADVLCYCVRDAQRVLRREPPFGALRVRCLELDLSVHVNNCYNSASTLAADLAASPYSMPGLRLHLAQLHDQAELNAVVDTALARSLSTVEFFHCRLSRASAPALAACCVATRSRTSRLWATTARCWTSLLSHCWALRCVRTPCSRRYL
jgi:hypothetical protein